MARAVLRTPRHPLDQVEHFGNALERLSSDRPNLSIGGKKEATASSKTGQWNLRTTSLPYRNSQQHQGV